MVTANHLWEEETERLLAEVLSELKAAQVKMEDLKKTVVELEAEVDAHQKALRSYRRRRGRPDAFESDWLQLLKGQSHKEQLVTIARHNEGRLNVGHTATLLYNRGFIKSKSRHNVYTIVSTTLGKMVDESIFEKVGPGHYRLLETQPTLQSKVAS